MYNALRPALQSALQRAWLHRGPLAWLLWPVSRLFGVLVWSRKQLYVHGILKPNKVDALVVVVGNAVAGGAGKTPTVVALCQHFQQLGYTVGIVSRGYGRGTTDCREVNSTSSPHEVGDEPLLIHRKTQIPVFVGSTRYAAAKALLAQHPKTHIVICDDGLQHYALYRDLEICVFDNRGCGNGWLLPAGPLREHWPNRPIPSVGQRPERLLTLHTGSQPAFTGYRAQRHLSSFAIQRDGSHVALSTLVQANSLPIVALAGIAQPEAFFAMLRARGIQPVTTVALPDHYNFDSYKPNKYERKQLICTEKDAVKLWKHVSDALAVPLELTIEPAFWSALDRCITEHMAATLAAKLSSRYGHTTS